MAPSATLASLAADVNLPEDVQTTLWQSLGLDPLVDLEVASEIPPDHLKKAIDDMLMEHQYPVAMSGRISLLFKRIYALFETPAAGSPDAGGTPESSVVTGPSSRHLKMSMVIDQMDDAKFEPLSIEQRAKYRVLGGVLILEPGTQSEITPLVARS